MPSPCQRFPMVMAVAMGLLSPASCPADVAMSMPRNIIISNLGEYGDLLFFCHADGQIVNKFLLDPKMAGPSGEFQLPYKELPVGKLSLLGVPRELAEKSKNAPDPAWLRENAPGVIRVAGVIHHYPVQKYSALHLYQLDKTDDGLTVTLLYPDVLIPYPAEDLHPEPKSENMYLWVALATGVAVLIVGFLVWMRKEARN